MHHLNATTLTSALLAIASTTLPAQSIARDWNELLLDAIRNDFARPTVHARNLYHVSVAMWDAWATYSPTADCVIFDEEHPTNDPNVTAWRNEAISHAAYHLMTWRFSLSPGAATMLPQFDALMASNGYSTTNLSVAGNTPAEIGNRIALNMINYGLDDNSNEVGGHANQFYFPFNTALLPEFPGNPNLLQPNRWQPLALQFFIGQSGIPIPTGYPEFLSPEWGIVKPFSLSQTDTVIHPTFLFDYLVYHDPGPPPLLDTPTADDYKWGFEMVMTWSAHLDPSDGVMIDISPGAIGNASLPTTSQYDQFYDFYEGGDWGTGHPVNPVTSQPYAPQVVPRGDYGRILAEFWADGPDSETPPGHWYTIANYVSDHPLTVKQIGGVGPVVDDLEWDVKLYLALGGAMHDCAIAAWGIKGRYDYLRPISALRYMADRYAANPSDPHAITLHPGLIEEVTLATTAPGQHHEHLAGEEGKVAVYAWRGPDYINDPLTDVAGVGWILAENWWPYQRPSFVTPPFAGYVSGHSTYSRAAAVIMDQFTGSQYFPGGLGEFQCPQNQFLVFEDGPSVNITLQWASYYDASDQCSLSRIWGGIHPPADDVPGRLIGQEIGVDAFARAEQVWNGNMPILAEWTNSGTGCPGSSGNGIELSCDPGKRPVLDSTWTIEATGLPLVSPPWAMMTGLVSIVPGIELSSIGMPGCTTDLQIIGADALVHSGGEGSWSMAIPNNPAWIGVDIFVQGLGLDPAANALGFITSTLGTGRVGL